ncbi:hypothetical protein [Amycolatopsis sp. NPDC054798]
MRLTWTLKHHGWAFCSVTDQHTSAEAVASYVTDGPEQLLRAVARITLYETDTQAEFEAEPDVYRWFFRRDANTVAIRLVHAADSRTPQHDGTLIWHSEQPTATLAKAVLRAFDTLVADLSEAGYQTQWGRPFPRHELEALRAAWRTTESAATGLDAERPHRHTAPNEDARRR